MTRAWKGEQAKQIQRGWLNYFRGTSIQGKLRDIDGWLRNRLRYCIWTDWKKPERKRKNLMRLGVDKDHAYAWSRTRKGGWRIAQSPILNTTITLQRLKKRGYQSMLEIYMELNPSLCEPPYTRPVRTVVWEAHSVSFWRSRLLDYAFGCVSCVALGYEYIKVFR